VSAQVLQRVVVRMLYDPAFQDAVFEAPEQALEGLDLAPEERRWLVEPDRRAYRTDPFRRARGLKGLLEEYPAASALAAAALGSVQALEAFFSAPQFHACIQERGSLAASFGVYLEARPEDRRVALLARVERAVAAVRRAPRPARSVAEQGLLGLAPQVELVRAPAGTLELYQAVRARLARFSSDPVEALLHPEFRLRGLPPLRGAEEQALLVLRHPEGEAGLEEIPPALADLLQAARRPRPLEGLLEEARRLGAEPGEDREIVEGLVRDGLLTDGFRLDTGAEAAADATHAPRPEIG
jgi:hypothetical protein